MCVILIVEDNPVDGKIIEKMVEKFLSKINKEGQIVVCKSAQDALNLCEELKPDVIITDINLGISSPTGFNLKEEIRKKNAPCKDIPFIFISSSDKPALTAAKAIAAGGFSFLPKPLCNDLLNEDLDIAIKFSEVQSQKCEARKRVYDHIHNIIDSFEDEKFDCEMKNLSYI